MTPKLVKTCCFANYLELCSNRNVNPLGCRLRALELQALPYGSEAADDP
jgi:hypothetical protein